jgi:hypothetical protein
LITSLTSTPATVIYTVTPSTSFYGTTCVGDPFTVTVTVNPRPLRIEFSYYYGGTQSPTQIPRPNNIRLSDNATTTITLTQPTYPARYVEQIVDYWYPSVAFQSGGFNAGRCIYRTGAGLNWRLDNSRIEIFPGDPSSPNVIYNIPGFLVTATNHCDEETFGPYSPQYGQKWEVQIRDFN